MNGKCNQSAWVTVMEEKASIMHMRQKKGHMKCTGLLGDWRALCFPLISGEPPITVPWMAYGPSAVKMHMLSTKKEKRQSYQENHLELGLQVTSLHLGYGLVWLVFFHYHYQKEGKIPPQCGSRAHRDPFCHRSLVFVITQLNTAACPLQCALHCLVFS